MGTPSEPSRREATPPTTSDPFASQWEDLRHQLRSWWDRLTEADLVQIGGQRDQLISVVQQRYGYTRERAQQGERAHRAMPRRVCWPLVSSCT